MDSLSTQKAKPRKMKTFVKKSRFQIHLDLFYRAIEITVVMVTVAKLCYQLVITFEGSGLTSFLMNRHLAFFLGNLIVMALFVKCGFFVNQEHDSGRKNNDFSDEFVRESSRSERRLQTDVICIEKQSETEREAKQSIEENRAKQSNAENRAKQSNEENRAKQSNEDKSGSERVKKDKTMKGRRQNSAQNKEIRRQSYQRSRSENSEGSKKSSCGKLKRSENERSANGFDTDDELRYKVESFIARQRRNQKDEEFCII